MFDFSKYSFYKDGYDEMEDYVEGIFEIDFSQGFTAGDGEALLKIDVPDSYHTNWQEFECTLQEMYESTDDWNIWSEIGDSWLKITKDKKADCLTHEEHLEFSVYVNDESLGVFEEDYSNECESEVTVTLVTDYISWQCEENVGMSLKELLDGKTKKYTGIRD